MNCQKTRQKVLLLKKNDENIKKIGKKEKEKEIIPLAEVEKDKNKEDLKPILKFVLDANKKNLLAVLLAEKEDLLEFLLEEYKEKPLTKKDLLFILELRSI